ncbi:7315_t:CDS:2 [Acaulospora morrowiae]|uniref:7315_t:CDS:1 n=1 Tax=Acaulospora morrowiae TaxID=94023 RepID=A0A9N8YZG6_9GLOM|nr:7315_t:CDS:2 [Acaulospora morrowiae]
MNVEGSQNFQIKYDKCSKCHNERVLKYSNGDVCTGCYSAQFQSVNSGNLDIDNLIKATRKNNIQHRLEWIPFKDFANIQDVAEGGFSYIYTALWTKGRVKSYSEEVFNRTGPIKIVLKILKNSQNINSEFIKEVNYVILLKPNPTPRSVILSVFMEYRKIQ